MLAGTLTCWCYTVLMVVPRHFSWYEDAGTLHYEGAGTLHDIHHTQHPLKM